MNFLNTELDSIQDEPLRLYYPRNYVGTRPSIRIQEKHNKKIQTFRLFPYPFDDSEKPTLYNVLFDCGILIENAYIQEHSDNTLELFKNYHLYFDIEPGKYMMECGYSTLGSSIPAVETLIPPYSYFTYIGYNPVMRIYKSSCAISPVNTNVL